MLSKNWYFISPSIKRAPLKLIESTRYSFALLNKVTKVQFASRSNSCISLLFFAGEFVAQFKFTVLLMPNGPLKITGADFDIEQCSTDNKIENEEILVGPL